MKAIKNLSLLFVAFLFAISVSAQGHKGFHRGKINKALRPQAAQPHQMVIKLTQPKKGLMVKPCISGLKMANTTLTKMAKRYTLKRINCSIQSL